MISVSDRVRLWLQTHPLHAKFLEDGLMNASALARAIKPELEQEAGDSITLESLILGINRQAKLTKSTALNLDDYIGDLSIQSGLSVIVVPNADLNPEVFAKAITILHKTREFTLYSKALSHTTLVSKQAVITELALHLPNTYLSQDIVALTIRLQGDYATVSGLCSYILQKIAMQNISLIEVISSDSELCLILHKTDAKRAVDCLV